MPEGEDQPRTFAGLFLKLIEEHPDGGHAKYERGGVAIQLWRYYGAKFLNGEQFDMLKALPPFEPGKGHGDLVTII